MINCPFGRALRAYWLLPLVTLGGIAQGCSESSDGGTSLSCGPGTVQSGSQCVAAAGGASGAAGQLACGPGTVQEGSQCVAAAGGAGGQVHCGPGTTLQGSECVVAAGGAGGLAGASGTAGTGGAASGAAGAAGSQGRPCETQCDCFSGTTCAVDKVCLAASPWPPGACDDLCVVDTDCPCNRKCDQGVCAMATEPKFAGAGTACKADCECPGNGGNAQACVGGRCITRCDVVGPQCVYDSQCAACSKICLADGRCAPAGQCFNTTDCFSQTGALCQSGNCTPPSGTRYATSDPLPASADIQGHIPLTIQVPAGITVAGIVVQLDVQVGFGMPPTGPIVLESPDGTSVTLASSFEYWIAKGGLTRLTYPSLENPPPNPQPDLSPFVGKSGSGTWTFTLWVAGTLQVADLALYIK